MRWSVWLSSRAQQDFQEILDWTAVHFGEDQADIYQETVSAAILGLETGPDQVGVKPLRKAAVGIFTLHVSRPGRKGRHFVAFRVVDRKRRVIEVVRLLHDSMDLGRHLARR